MLWLKWVLGYCVLVAVGLWFGYRSRDVLPGRESGSPAAHDLGGTRESQDSGRHGQTR